MKIMSVSNARWSCQSWPSEANRGSCSKAEITRRRHGEIGEVPRDRKSTESAATSGTFARHAGLFFDPERSK